MSAKEIDNMALWNAVCTTAKEDTKHVNARGGYTAICAQSQVMAATKLFGPLGIGWGFKDEQIFAIDGTIIYQAIFWYIHEGRAGEFPMSSSIKASIDDAVKKVCTDSITKALSRIGFNADVFMGKFDDNKYVGETDSPDHAAKYKEGEELTKGQINELIWQLEQKAHENKSERDNSREKHLGHRELGDASVDRLREYYVHLKSKIKEKEKADV